MKIKDTVLYSYSVGAIVVRLCPFTAYGEGGYVLNSD